MRWVYHCPLCEAVLKREAYYNEVGIEEESYVVCKKCQYSDVHAYGSYERDFSGLVTIYWHYATPGEEVKLLFAHFQSVINKVKYEDHWHDLSY